MLGPVTTRMRVLAPSPSAQSLPTKLAPSLRRKFCSTMGWRPSSTAKTRLASILGPHIVLLDRQARRGRHNGRARQARRSPPRAPSPRPARLRSSRAKISSSMASARSAAWVMRASSSASSGVEKRIDIGERLAVDEQLDMRRLAQDGAMQRGDLDEIAEHVVVAHLQRFDAGRLGVSRLQAGDDLAAAVAQAPVLIEIAIGAVPDEAAVARIDGKRLGERRRKRLLDRGGCGFEPSPRCRQALAAGRARPRHAPGLRQGHAPRGLPRRPRRDRAGPRGPTPDAPARGQGREPASAPRAGPAAAAAGRRDRRPRRAAHSPPPDRSAGCPAGWQARARQPR